MAKTLVIVESPAKAKTIEKFLGKSHYTVKASVGHVRDLPKSKLGVDIENNFEPQYINIRGKGDLIKELKKEAKKSKKVYLATDPDREGEAISWHLAYILGLDQNDECRIEFNEITKDAIKKAIKSPRNIDINLVDAQQARRVLDRLLGYQISPILWQKVRKGLSAGRVQSVTTKLICDREKEIEALLNFPKLDTPKLIRDKAIFEVLYGTGIKVSELVDMDIEDVDLELDYIYCNIAKNKRVIPLSDTTKVYLEKYIKEARPKITEDTENALFVNSLGQRFTRQGLWKLIKKYASIANINKNINPSMLRHSFAIHLLNEGANIAVVSKILGNANLSSLQAYLNHINKNMRREIKEKHPRK